MVRKQNAWREFSADRYAARRRQVDSVLKRIEALQCSLREAASEAELLISALDRDTPDAQSSDAVPPLTSPKQLLAMDA